MRLFLLIPLLALAACNGSAEQACTMIGCSDGLTVHMNGGEPAGPYTARALVNDIAVATFECSQGGCPEFWLENVTASTVTVEITPASGQSWTATFSPEYEEFQPNGPGCPPICRQATVRMPLP